MGVIHNSDNSQTQIYEGEYEIIEHLNETDPRYQNPMLDTFHHLELGLLKSDTMRRTNIEGSCPTTQTIKPPPPYPGTKPPIVEKPKRLSTFVPVPSSSSHTSCVFENHIPQYEYITDDIHNFFSKTPSPILFINQTPPPTV